MELEEEIFPFSSFLIGVSWNLSSCLQLPGHTHENAKTLKAKAPTYFFTADFNVNTFSIHSADVCS
jgi:hypothetical protein